MQPLTTEALRLYATNTSRVAFQGVTLIYNIILTLYLSIEWIAQAFKNSRINVIDQLLTQKQLESDS